MRQNCNSWKAKFFVVLWRPRWNLKKKPFGETSNLKNNQLEDLSHEDKNLYQEFESPSSKQINFHGLSILKIDAN